MSLLTELKIICRTIFLQICRAYGAGEILKRKIPFAYLAYFAVARLIFGGEMNLQSPPNLLAEDYPDLLKAGINDWGGVSPLGHARQSIKIKNGIESSVAKEITGFIRDGKFKVTTQIQGDEVRVNSKSRDELQTVIAAVRAHEFPVAVQFVNFRD